MCFKHVRMPPFYRAETDMHFMKKNTFYFSFSVPLLLQHFSLIFYHLTKRPFMLRLCLTNKPQYLCDSLFVLQQRTFCRVQKQARTDTYRRSSRIHALLHGLFRRYSLYS